ELDMVKGVTIDGSNVIVEILLTVAGCPLKDRLTKDVTAAVSPLEGVGHVEVVLGVMTEEQRQAMVAKLRAGQPQAQERPGVYWGDVEYVLVDMPPGTGDVSISIAQYLPGAEMLLVTTPQEAASKVAARAGKMTEQVNLQVLGVIENMSYFLCPSCGEKHRIFGEGGGKTLS